MRSRLTGPNRASRLRLAQQRRATGGLVVVQVSGPPCAGKTTLLAQYARDGFATMDDYAWMRAERGVMRRGEATDADWRAWYDALERAVMMQTRNLAYIQGRPFPRFPGVNVVNLGPNVTAEECHRRAREDRRPADTHLWVDEWFSKYG